MDALEELIAKQHIPPEEIERRRRGAERLAERLGKVPFYAECARRDGSGYWEKFYASRIKS